MLWCTSQLQAHLTGPSPRGLSCHWGRVLAWGKWRVASSPSSALTIHTDWLRRLRPWAWLSTWLAASDSRTQVQNSVPWFLGGEITGLWAPLVLTCYSPVSPGNVQMCNTPLPHCDSSFPPKISCIFKRPFFYVRNFSKISWIIILTIWSTRALSEWTQPSHFKIEKRKPSNFGSHSRSQQCGREPHLGSMLLVQLHPGPGSDTKQLKSQEIIANFTW